FSAWLNNTRTKSLSDAQKDIVWRARTSQAIPLLASLASDPGEELNRRLRYFRAFDFNPNGTEKSAALVNMLQEKITTGDVNNEEQAQIKKLILTHLDPSYIMKSYLSMKTLHEVRNNIW